MVRWRKDWGLVDGLAALLTGVLTVSVLLQVVVRFVLKTPMPWTEEVARISFVYTVFLGAVIGMREKKHVNVDIVVKALRAGTRIVWETVTDIVVALLLGAIVCVGARFVAVSFDQVTPYLRIPIALVYLCIPVCSALMLYHVLRGTLSRFAQLRRKE